MTAQISESLLLDGEQVPMMATPLSQYFELGGERPEFHAMCSALWRGYRGSWEIIDDRLYLVGLQGTGPDGRTITQKDLFPDYAERAFAHWYSGTIRIPRGKLLEYVHAGFGSQYEQDLILTLDRGVVVSRQVIHNGTAPEGASEGYSPAAMTVFQQGDAGGKQE